MTQTEAIDLLWTAKDVGTYDKPNPNLANAFVYATTRREITFRIWNGNHPVEKNERAEKKPAATRVLVTMVSRFGDVGIRAHNLVPASNGYSARVQPEDLTDWSMTPAVPT